MLVFLTFGDGSYHFRAAGRRIAREAAELDTFSKIIVYDFNKLIIDHNDFWKENQEFILGNRRGAGYWIWKAFIIQEVLKKMGEDDLLLYADAGCEINKNFSYNIDEILPESCDLTLFELKGHSNEAWTNSFTLKILNASKTIRACDQLAATVIVMKNNQSCRKLVHDWVNFCSINDKALLIDRNDDENNYFQEHRHDQSILSILTEKMIFEGRIKIKKLDSQFLDLQSSVIRASRNRSGIPPSIRATFIFRMLLTFRMYLIRALKFFLALNRP